MASEVVLLPAGPCVLIHMPLGITFFVFQSPTSNLKESHSDSRSNFRELHALVACTHKDVMSHFNTVIDILERDYPVAHFLICRRCLTWRKDVFEDLTNTFT